MVKKISKKKIFCIILIIFNILALIVPSIICICTLIRYVPSWIFLLMIIFENLLPFILISSLIVTIVNIVSDKNIKVSFFSFLTFCSLFLSYRLSTSKYMIWQLAVAIISSVICLIMQICGTSKKTIDNS